MVNKKFTLIIIIFFPLVIIAFADISFAENYEFCKDPLYTIHYVNGTLKELSRSDNFSDFSEIGIKIYDDCKIDWEDLPPFDYAVFSKTSKMNSCNELRSCYGTFANGTEIKIQCMPMVQHGCARISYQELSLKKQSENGLPTDQIRCPNNDHVLVQRTNEKLACVYPSTAEKFDWKFVHE